VHIQFEVPADPAYAGRVTNVLSGLYLRKYAYIGAGLVAIGAIGIAGFALKGSSGNPAVSFFIAMVVAGVLSLLFVPWVQYSNRRRSTGNAVEGSYDITDESVRMRSGTESHAIAWDEVTGVTEAHDFWILFIGRTPATVIPREFMSAGDAQELERFLTARGPAGE
jgi:hypothetical protein